MAKIMIVDDSPSIHRLLKKLAQLSGHEVVACAFDGNEASELYQKHSPDLVLMDVTMPNCDGREGLRKIKNHTPNARVMMLSALTDPSTIDQCMQGGAVGFASKDRLGEDGYLESIIQQSLKSILVA